jgi:hypothetical protein
MPWVGVAKRSLGPTISGGVRDRDLYLSVMLIEFIIIWYSILKKKVINLRQNIGSEITLEQSLLDMFDRVQMISQNPRKYLDYWL